jgi:NADH dehydrogenase/NADH:ubiquinone oxidoreductase subunit G
MKIRLADVIGGAAKSLDQRLQEDMRRTEERAENTARERRQKKEALSQKEKEFDEAMTTYVEGIQSTLGPNATYADAVRVVKDYGGNLAGAERAYKAFTESSDAGIDVSTLVSYSQGTDSATLPELVASMRPASLTSMQPLGSGEVTGTGFLRGVDLSERINQQVPVTTQTRRTFDIGDATVDRSGLLAGIEGQAKISSANAKKRNTTYTALHVQLTEQIMAEQDKPNPNTALISQLVAKRKEAHTQWLEFQLREGGANNAQGQFDKDLVTSIPTIIKSARDLAMSKFAVKGIDGKISTVISGNEGEAFDLEKSAYQEIIDTAYSDSSKFSLLHQNARAAMKAVDNRISAFKNAAETNYNRLLNEDAALVQSGYTKFVDLTNQQGVTAATLTARGKNGEFSKNAVVKFKATDANGQVGTVKLLWTGYKFI